MGLFKRKSDPLAERSRALNAQIAELEERIKQLSEAPVSTSTALPRPRTPASAKAPPSRPQPMAAPVFVPPVRPTAPVAPREPAPRELYNDLGVRKFDLVDAVRRLTSRFRRPPPSNPHLVKYLASGGLPGMRALRYEKRVARNRFIGLVIVFTVVLWILVAAFLKNQ
jgi:hypothetical protein